MKFVSELKRRNVFRVTAAYAVVAWLLMQAADILLGNFGAPGWAFRSFVVLLALGLPVAAFLAWAYELTPEGIRPEGDAQAPDPTARSKPIDRIIVYGLIAVIAALVAERYWPARLDEAGPEQPVAGTATAATTVIAVLPFANLSADPEQEFFADGMTEDILTRLSGVAGLRIISRTSVMRYKHTELGIPEIAATLGATHILEGSVRRAGQQVRITGQLIRAVDDNQLWAESFDRDVADIFAVQSEIAAHIVEALEVTLTDRERMRLGYRGTDNIEAYERYLQGVAIIESLHGSPEATQRASAQAEEHFRAALALDPDFGPAAAQVARALLLGINTRPHDEVEVRLREAVAAARLAIRLAPGQAAGYLHLGRVHFLRGELAAAREQLLLALEIQPGDFDTLMTLADLHRNLGQYTEAFRSYQQALRVNPEAPLALWHVAYAHAQAGGFDVALKLIARAYRQMGPAFVGPYNCFKAQAAVRMGDAEAARRALAAFDFIDEAFADNCRVFVLARLGDFEAAAEYIARSPEFFDELNVFPAATIAAGLGQSERMEDLLNTGERRIAERHLRPSPMAQEMERAELAALRGRQELAISHLDRAVELGWRSHRELSIYPAWDAVREHPRFEALERIVEEDLARIRAELQALDLQW